MVCSKCGGETKVIETVQNTRDNVIHRMRKCETCRRNFYTTELEVDFNSTLKKTLSEYRGSYIHRRATRSSLNKVKVRCVDTGEIFESVSAAARSIYLNRSAITNCCRGRLKTAGGKKWEYYEENEKENEE